MCARTLDKAAVTVVGAGIIGLAVAARLADKHSPLYILEKNDSFGRETSSRGSETIHAGIYYPQGSLKATTCVDGNALLYELCQRHNLPVQRTGKLIVATNEAELAELDTLLQLGKANGARDLHMLTRRQVKEVEPNVEAAGAVFSPTSGVVDSFSLMRYFLARAAEGGATTAYSTRVVAVSKEVDGYVVGVEDGSGSFEFKTAALVNCAGLHAHEIAQAAGIDIDKAQYRVHYCKGEYFSVGNGKNRLVSRLVYPVPDPTSGGMGIHNVFDVEGRMLLGPNARYVDEIDYRVDESQRQTHLDSVKPFLPFIEAEDLEPDIAGIRPKLRGPGDGFRDFVIEHEEDRGLPGMVNLIGIESPGLTSAPAIARLVADMIKEAA